MSTGIVTFNTYNLQSNSSWLNFSLAYTVKDIKSETYSLIKFIFLPVLGKWRTGSSYASPNEHTVLQNAQHCWDYERLNPLLNRKSNDRAHIDTKIIKSCSWLPHPSDIKKESPNKYIKYQRDGQSSPCFGMDTVNRGLGQTVKSEQSIDHTVSCMSLQIEAS